MTKEIATYKNQLKNHISYTKKSVEGTKQNISHLKKRIKNLQSILLLEQESLSLDLTQIKRSEIILSKVK